MSACPCNRRDGWPSVPPFAPDCCKPRRPDAGQGVPQCGKRGCWAKPRVTRHAAPACLPCLRYATPAPERAVRGLAQYMMPEATHEALHRCLPAEERVSVDLHGPIASRALLVLCQMGPWVQGRPSALFPPRVVGRDCDAEQGIAGQWPTEGAANCTEPNEGRAGEPAA